MDSQALLSTSPSSSSSSISYSSSDCNDYLPNPLIRKSIIDDRGGNGGAELGGGTSDVESEDAGFVSAEEEVLDKVHGFGLVTKVSNDDNGDEEDKEDGDFDEEEFEEEVEEEELFVNGGGGGEGEERSVFVVKKLGDSSEEEGGGDLVVEKQAMRFGNLPGWAVHLSYSIKEAVVLGNCVEGSKRDAEKMSSSSSISLVLPRELLNREPLFEPG